MNPELLKTIHYSTEIIYPPLQNLEKQSLVDFYSNISKIYEYPSFTLIPNGAQLSHPNGSALRLLPDRVYLQDEDAQLDIQHFVDKSRYVMDYMQNSMNISNILFQTVVIRSLWPCGPGISSRDILMNNFFNFNDDDYATLGRPVGGAGIRLNLPGDKEILDIRIEPWFRNMNQLFIEIRGEFTNSDNKPSLQAERINKVYDYLFQDISRFVIGKLKSDV
jgi:hypothetical protein